MGAFKLKIGQFVQADKSKPVKDSDGKPTGRFERRTHVANGGATPTVESDVDLVARFGPEKFERLDAAGESQTTYIADLERQLAEARAAGFVPTAAAQVTHALSNPAFAPNGQVSSGFQANGGPLDPALAARAGVAGASEQGKGSASATAGDADDLDGMTVAELRDYADTNEIDLAGAHRKDEIVAKIRAGR